MAARLLQKHGALMDLASSGQGKRPIGLHIADYGVICIISISDRKPSLGQHQEPTPPPKVSAFVQKLFAMLSDPSLAHLIWWSRTYQNDFTTFALLPGAEFANALTGYFKHGNVASFVRQLHMYGFHKVCDNNPPPVPPSRPNESLSEEELKNMQVWEFRHSTGRFRKGDEGSLCYIKRRSSGTQKATSQQATEFVAAQYFPPQQPHPDHFYQPVEYQPTVYIPYPDVPPPPPSHQQVPYEYNSHIVLPSMPDVEHKSRNATLNTHISDSTEVSFQSSSRNRYPSVFLDPLAPAPHIAPIPPQNPVPLQYYPHSDQQYPQLPAPPHVANQRRTGSYPKMSAPLMQHEMRLPRSIPNEYFPQSPAPQSPALPPHRFNSPVSRPAPSQPLTPRRNTPPPQPPSHQRIMQMRPSVYDVQHNMNSVSSISTGGSNSIFSRTSVGSSIMGPTSSMVPLITNTNPQTSSGGRNSSISDLLNSESRSHLQSIEPAAQKDAKRSFDSDSEPEEDLMAKKKLKLSSLVED
ncbi:hypothetical protein KL951_004160 [Ogataea haglerorum]|nr:hypothetical protein KL951_004160 [Ogataea haglerorum]